MANQQATRVLQGLCEPGKARVATDERSGIGTSAYVTQQAPARQDKQVFTQLEALPKQLFWNRADFEGETNENDKIFRLSPFCCPLAPAL